MLPQPRPSLRTVYLIDAVSLVAAALYTLAQRSPPPFVSVFVAFAPIIAVGMWFQHYLRQERVALPFDFGYLFLIGWPVLIPVFTKRLSLQNRWRFATALYALGLAPVLLTFLLDILMWLLG